MLWKQAIECLMSTAEATAMLAVGFALFRQPIKSNWLKFSIIGFIISLLYILQTEYSEYGECAYVVQMIAYIVLISGMFEAKLLDSFLYLVTGVIVLGLLQLIFVDGYIRLGWLDKDLFQEILWNRAFVQGSEVIGSLLILTMLHKKKIGFIYRQTDFKKSFQNKHYIIFNGLLISCLITFQIAIIYFTAYPLLLILAISIQMALLFIVIYTINKQHILRRKH